MATWYDRLPKVELHLHLEGAIPYNCLWDLVDKYGGDPSVPDRQALERRFVYRDFPHFLETWRWKNGFLRAYEDFEHLAQAVARDLARQNVRYAEVFYSPPDFFYHGLKTQRLTEAIRSGLDKVAETKIALIADLVRDSSPAAATITLEQVNEVQDQGVIGIGIGGAEQSIPRNPLARSMPARDDWGCTPQPTPERPLEPRACGGRSGPYRWNGSATAPGQQRTRL